MNKTPLGRIGIDLMGSEGSPLALFDGVILAAESLPAGYQLVALGTPEVFDAIAAGHFGKCFPNEQLVFLPTGESIEMDHAPLYAVRTKRDSSLVTGIRSLSEGTLDAFISAGNTGALVASASLMLPKLPGIDRPALLAVLPTRKGGVAVVDVGGNVSSKAQHLVQFAQMGAAYQRSCGIETPVVGLLNIGVESKKGTPEHRLAHDKLRDHPQPGMQFIGNIEGRDVYAGKVDVLVTDGFTGNVFLKTSEGVSAFLLDYLRDALPAGDTPSKVKQVLKNLHNHIDYDQYPGAIVCGVDGVVIKCHGGSSPRALCNGIRGATALLQSNWLAAMKRSLQEGNG